MSLYGSRGPRRGEDFHIGDPEARELQRLSSRIWLRESKLLEDVALTAYSANDIEHGLGRKLRGYEVVRRPALRGRFFVDLQSNVTGHYADGTPTVVPFDTATLNENSRFSLATETYTVGATGLHHFEVSAAVNNITDADPLVLDLYINGVAARRLYRTTSGAAAGHNLNGAITIPLSVGNLVKFMVTQTSGGAKDAGANSGLNTWASGGPVDELGSGQSELTETEQKLYLRLYSSCDRTVSILVW